MKETRKRELQAHDFWDSLCNEIVYGHGNYEARGGREIIGE